MLDRAVDDRTTQTPGFRSNCVLCARTAQQLMEPAEFSALLVEMANNPGAQHNNQIT